MIVEQLGIPLKQLAFHVYTLQSILMIKIKYLTIMLLKLVAFAFNPKSYAITFVFVFAYFFFLVNLFGRTTKAFPIFNS